MQSKKDGELASNNGTSSVTPTERQGSVTAEPQKIFVDGIQSIASHNGVHRVVFFNLVGDGRSNEPVLELIIPASSIRAVGEALVKAGR